MTAWRWFGRQPVHRKIGLLALTVTLIASVLAMTGLMVAETLRIDRGAREDVASLAQVIAQNASAALVFDRPDEATEMLGSLRYRPQVRRACLYTLDNELFAHFERPDERPCPPAPPDGVRTMSRAATAAVLYRDRQAGSVFVERDLRILWWRLLAFGSTGGSLLLIATLLAFGLAQRLQRSISEPIVELAAAARTVGRGSRYVMPPLEAPPDEVGELVHAFSEMVTRIRTTTVDLEESNASLRREIEERKRIEAEHERLIEREQEANRLKDEFLAAVSHELRTPLNAIVGWTRVLMRGTPEPETLARALASLHRNAEAQARVIDDLIDISRIVKGKLHVRFEPVDLREVVEAAADVIRPVAEQKSLTLALRVAGPCPVSGDRDRLQQIVWNLLSNAVKFTPARGIVTVETRSTPSECQVIVRDTGVGIAPSFLPHLFERFRQADASMTREYTGLGIGLAIVHELVELHGGTIHAASDGRDTGATFTVTLPCLQASADSAGSSRRREVAPLPSLRGANVLVVDDNADALETLEALLSDAGAQVRTAASGQAALALWAQRPPDVLICDLAMPGMSGYELLGRIRDLDARHGRVTPAIAVTAQAAEEQVARSMRVGFHAHIAKPFDAAAVVRGVLAALETA